ncbi:Uncharacterised protein [Corynebacterium renale]|uniref:Uncharacterized protein n=2 Tax=Corynebacterium renale TaxID=1724 RepID=A0A2A9DM67_9CORY|nr:hypothetical protein ATK06_0516 [Corynebacterium renale]SQG63852.1 Uncharacterised protein [Corynebacterium renale]SQI23324.1 Uncharacterised protein [Corynebacterium renale]STD02424.1 Uncharacterised protein [Corynebacterium renale]
MFYVVVIALPILLGLFMTGMEKLEAKVLPRRAEPTTTA